MTAYTILPIPPAPYGQTARIALCDSFKGAVQAKADGCHAAIVASSGLPPECACLMKEAEAFMAESRESEAMATLKDARDLLHASLSRNPYGRFIRGQRLDCKSGSRFGAHIDSIGAKDYIAVYGVSATTILYTRFLDDRDDLPLDCGEIVALKDLKPDTPGSGGFCPMPGDLVFLFKVAKGRSLAHSVPDAPFIRARIGFSGQFPVPGNRPA